MPPLLFDTAPASENHSNTSHNVENIYLISICTGIGPNAGTTTSIRIRVHGTDHTTGSVLLQSPKDGHFVRGSIRHYRLCTIVGLGSLLAITLAHNSSGRHPSWFCDWVRIRDVRRNDEWLFLVRRWLSLAVGFQAQCTCAPIDERAYRSRWLRFRWHVRQLLVNKSIWYSLLLNNSSNAGRTAMITRTQRVAVAAVSLVCSLLTNVMFFGRTEEETVEQEQRQQYARLTASVRLIVVAVQSAIIALILTWAVNLLLMWSRTRREQVRSVRNTDEKVAADGGGFIRMRFADEFLTKI